MVELKALTDIQLTELAKKLNLPLENILMRDEMNELKNDGFYIINLDTSENTGTHWTSMYKHPLQSYYFDSYGFVPPLEVEIKIKPYLYNERDIQDWNSKACGWFCIAFIIFLCDKNDKEIASKEFLNLFSRDTKENDEKLKKNLEL